MKPGIHPKWYPEAQVTCACGNTWKVGATIEAIRTDVCSKCHPFFTGEQRIVDTEGQVERFVRRLEQAVGDQARTKRQKAAQRKQRRAIVELVDEAEA
jgi:large subunit ribosomal protein L31